MSAKNDQQKRLIEIASGGTVLGNEGRELRRGLWENGVYLGADGFVYELAADQARGELKIAVRGKRPVGEYLRWVDGLFRPGEVPTATTGIHYRAARKLRELL